MTTAVIANPCSPVRVVFDGQSLNAVPVNHTYPRTMMANYFAGVPWNNVPIGATSWLTLQKTAAIRTYPLAPLASYAILVTCGGTSDILTPAQTGGDGDPDGATVMAHYTATTDAARAAGYDYVIASTITPDEFGFNGTQESIRNAANTLIKANGGGHFDAVCDFAGDPRLGSIPHDAGYMDPDGLHPIAAGADVMAALMAPYVAAAIAKAGG